MLPIKKIKLKINIKYKKISNFDLLVIIINGIKHKNIRIIFFIFMKYMICESLPCKLLGINSNLMKYY